MRLSRASLDRLPPAVARPDYDPARLETGIIHLGIGAFHRAHQAVYTDGILRNDPRWGILGVSLRSPGTRDALAPQDGLYTVSAMDGGQARRRVIGASTGLLVAPEDPAALLRHLAAPSVRIVTTTVTEKGYSQDPATGALDETDPDIRHDLAHPDQPRTTIGTLVAGLRHRRAAGLAPFTILACDNLPENGRRLRGLVTRFAERADPDLGAWIAGETRFPSTMVDRIVPATTEADRAAIATAIGQDDAWPIVTEPFCQWVIEDDFALGRPDWDQAGPDLAGAQFVADVIPYELMKLRLLNGSHSTLAYLGYLMGHETVAEAMSEPDLARLVADLMRLESGPTLAALPGFDLAGYQRSLIARFRNPALRHRTWQIAMDGSHKLPQRLLAPIRARLQAGQPIARLTLGVAAWMRYVTGIDETGAPIDVRDPLASRLKALADAAGPVAARLAPALLSLETVFGTDLPRDPRFVDPVIAALDRLFTLGAKATLAGFQP